MVPCVICRTDYPLAEIGSDLFISTGVCRQCYRAGLRLPDRLWCFGSESVYDSEDPVCRDRCPDRRICKMVVRRWIRLGPS